MFQVILHRRIIVTDGLVFDAERELSLPIPPFIGMYLYNVEWSPPDCDDSEDVIKAVGYSLKTGRLMCYLPIVDYRFESSGSDDWTEEDMRRHYRDWKLDRDHNIGPAVADE